MIELENVFKPKKRVFVSLTLASAVIGCDGHLYGLAA